MPGKRTWVPQAIAVALLLAALNPNNPYGYYVLLRWICFGIFGYLSAEAFRNGRHGWTWILGITAGIYNPFIRVHLTRELWSLVNVITIGILLASVFAKWRGAGPPSVRDDISSRG